MIDLFISHATVEDEYADRLKANLQQHGITTWIDHDKGIEPGCLDWEREIRQAIATCKAGVLLMSPASLASQYCKAEIFHLTDTLHRIVYLAVIQPINARDVWLNINSNQRFNLVGGNFESGADQLAQTYLSRFPNDEAVRNVIGDPFEWCDVSADNFLYGTQNTSIALPVFQIAKYPITYEQFQEFVDTYDGFYDPRWWEGLACDQHHRNAPGQQRFQKTAHPRENVSWYDAIAFCRWLSYRLNTPYDLNRIAEWAVRLPTVFEWERAARGVRGLIYPYPGPFDRTKCNTSEARIGGTTRVDTYRSGTSPVGALDMSGNVWEWCLSNYNDLKQDATQENLSANLTRSIRGGSWDYPADVARVDRKGFVGMPDDRGQEPGDGQVGFRIVCSI